MASYIPSTELRTPGRQLQSQQEQHGPLPQHPQHPLPSLSHNPHPANAMQVTITDPWGITLTRKMIEGVKYGLVESSVRPFISFLPVSSEGSMFENCHVVLQLINAAVNIFACTQGTPCTLYPQDMTIAPASIVPWQKAPGDAPVRHQAVNGTFVILDYQVEVPIADWRLGLSMARVMEKEEQGGERKVW